MATGSGIDRTSRWQCSIRLRRSNRRPGGVAGFAAAQWHTCGPAGGCGAGSDTSPAASGRNAGFGPLQE